jgi:hypothetical protein
MTNLCRTILSSRRAVAAVAQVLLIDRDPETGIRSVVLDKQKDCEDGLQMISRSPG